MVVPMLSTLANITGRLIATSIDTLVFAVQLQFSGLRALWCWLDFEKSGNTIAKHCRTAACDNAAHSSRHDYRCTTPD
jgi:hypothetical protein